MAAVSLDADDTDDSEGEADCGEDGRDDAGGTASVSRLSRGGPAIAGLAGLARCLLGAEWVSGSHLRGFCHTLAGAVGGLDDSARLHGTMVEGDEVSEYWVEAVEAEREAETEADWAEEEEGVVRLLIAAARGLLGPF